MNPGTACRRSGSAEEAPTLEQCRRCAHRIAILVVAGNIFLGVLKVALGIFAQSASVAADGLQSFACAVVGVFVMAGLKFSKKPADYKFPYGYGKIEFLVSVVSYAGLFGLGLFMVFGSACLLVGGRFSGPSSISLPVSAISVLCNYLMYRACQCSGTVTDSAGLLANAKQNQADMFSSMAVLISVTLAQLGPLFYWCDSLGAGIVGLFIMREAAACWWSDMRVLLDTSLSRGKVSQIRAAVTGVEGVRQTQFVQARRTGDRVRVDLGVLVSPDRTVSKAQEICWDARAAIMRKLNWVQEVDVYVYPASQSGSRAARAFPRAAGLQPSGIDTKAIR